MGVSILTVVIIVILILTNGITDAPNAIATVVGTKVLSFKNAAKISAVFNFLGIITMSIFNISVATCISKIVDINMDIKGFYIIVIGMISVILFALIALKYGIPTSETHGLIAGLTGASVGILGISTINIGEWTKVLVGLIGSIIGTLIITYVVVTVLKKHLEKIDDVIISKLQIGGMCAMSFMHGAQDGQKFIGILIMHKFITQGISIPEKLIASDYIFIIIFTAIIMFLGVSIGGKKIVQNIGSDMITLSKKEALFSDISTSITLFLASLNGIPVSTTHVKTISIFGVGVANKKIISKKIFSQVIKAWILTFPVCFFISFFLSKIIM